MKALAKKKAKEKAKAKAQPKKPPKKKKEKAAMSFLKCFAKKRKASADIGAAEACETEKPEISGPEPPPPFPCPPPASNEVVPPELGQRAEPSPPSPCVPAASNEVPPDLEPPPSQKPVGETDTGEPDPKKYKKTYKSPEELLSLVVPPMCTIALAFTSWRFVRSWKVPAAEHGQLLPPYSQKTMSLTLIRLRSWREALSEVHAHSWKNGSSGKRSIL